MLFFGAFLGFVFVVLVQRVRIIAQLIAVTQIADHLAREAGKGGLIIQHVADVFQRAAGLFLDIAAPQFHRVFGTGGQGATRGQMAHKISCGDGKGHITGLFGLIIAFAQRFVLDLDVDVGRGAGHVARANGFATCGFHRLIKVARHIALRGIARMGLTVVIAAVQRQRICGAARQQHFFAGHPARHLRQAHGVARKARGVDRIADRQIGVVGHDF